MHWKTCPVFYRFLKKFSFPLETFKKLFESKKFSFYKGPSINDIAHFLKIFDPSLPLVTHFTKYAYGVTSLFGRSPKWVTSFMDGPKQCVLFQNYYNHFHIFTPCVTAIGMVLPGLSKVSRHAHIFFALVFFKGAVHLYFASLVS